MNAPWPSTPALVLGQVRHQNRMFWRSPVSAFFALALPLIMLVLFNALFEGQVDGPEGPIGISQFYTAGLAVFSAASATYTNLGIGVAIQRDEGILKRVRGTPLPPWVHMAGLVGSAVWLALIGVTMMITVGVVFYDLEVAADKLPAAAVTFIVGVSTFAALGLALAAMARNGTAAPAIANATILPLAFVSNIFIALEDPPRWVEIIGDIFPLKPFASAFQDAFNPFVEAPAFDWSAIGWIAVWGVAGAVVAQRFHRWEPARGTTGGRRSRRVRAASA